MHLVPVEFDPTAVAQGDAGEGREEGLDPLVGGRLGVRVEPLGAQALADPGRDAAPCLRRFEPHPVERRLVHADRDVHHTNFVIHEPRVNGSTEPFAGSLPADPSAAPMHSSDGAHRRL